MQPKHPDQFCVFEQFSACEEHQFGHPSASLCLFASLRFLRFHCLTLACEQLTRLELG